MPLTKTASPIRVMGRYLDNHCGPSPARVAYRYLNADWPRVYADAKGSHSLGTNLPRWMKAYRAVDAGHGRMTDAVEGGIYFFPKRETAELWAGQHGHVIERLIRTDTASVWSTAEGDLPYFIGDTEDVIIRTDPRGSGKVLEIIVFNKAFLKVPRGRKQAKHTSASRVASRYLDNHCGPSPRVVVAANLKALKPRTRE